MEGRDERREGDEGGDAALAAALGVGGAGRERAVAQLPGEGAAAEEEEVAQVEGDGARPEGRLRARVGDGLYSFVLVC